MLISQLFENAKFTDYDEWKAAVEKKWPKAEWSVNKTTGRTLASSPEVESSHGAQSSETYAVWYPDKKMGVIY
jgi:hypothetical protein